VLENGAGVGGMLLSLLRRKKKHPEALEF